MHKAILQPDSDVVFLAWWLMCTFATQWLMCTLFHVVKLNMSFWCHRPRDVVRVSCVCHHTAQASTGSASKLQQRSTQAPAQGHEC